MTGSAVTRRAMLGFVGAGAALVAGAGAVGALEGPGVGSTSPGDSRLPFEGAHQQGIVTPSQEHLSFVALDLSTTSRAALISLMREWTVAARYLTIGRPVGRTGAVGGLPDDIPEDIGLALDLPASRLTITVGFGQSLFDNESRGDRFGLSRQRPNAFVDLPEFPGDRLVPSLSHGDICIQVCADDQQVAHHAIRSLVRIAADSTRVRWRQSGFGKSTTAPAGTPRNLFGFKDGTANIGLHESDAHARWVWVQPGDGPEWMTGGTYLAARRIEMTLEEWDEETLSDQEQTFGRTKGTGAPLSGGRENTPPDFTALRVDGQPMIHSKSHVALSSPANNNGLRILRRGYNFLEGSRSDGTSIGGLFFIGFNRDLRTQFIPLQRRLSEADELNEYLRYRSSAAFAIPPGVRSQDAYLGQELLES